MARTERFAALSSGLNEPKSAHPGYGSEARVEVSDKSQTLHFLKEKKGFHVTLYYDPREDGSAPAISLGFVSDERVSLAIQEEVLSIEGGHFNLGNTRALRRIL